MAHVYVIGGTGLIGPSLVRELQELGHEVICLNRSAQHPFGGQAITLDRNDHRQLSALFATQADIDHLIDMIPYTAIQAGTLIAALDGRQIPLTAISSIDVYETYNLLHGVSQGPIQAQPLKEDAQLRHKLSSQGAGYDKLNVERIYQSYFTDCCLIRLPAVYGLPDVSRIEHFAKPLLKGEPIRLHPRLADWRFARSANANCAYAIALSVGITGQHTYHVGELESYTERAWCERIASLANLPLDLCISEQAELTFDMRCEQDWYVDSTKIRSELGYHEKHQPESIIRQVISHLHSSAAP